MDLVEQSTLLVDALDRVIINPAGSYNWLNLMVAMRMASTAELRHSALETLSSQVSNEGIAGFYHAMFLDMATGDHSHLAQAANILALETQPDLDRMAALIQTGWQRALLYAQGRPGFMRAIEQAGLPYISALIGKHVATRCLPLPARKIIDVRRVALVATNLSHTSHPPTLMALDQATVLLKSGLEVSLFACQESSILDHLHLLGTGAHSAPFESHWDAWAPPAGTSAQIHTSDQRFSLMRRWKDMHASIAAFDPDLVFLVGLHSGLIPALYRSRPVLAMGSSSVPPLTPGDVWLSAQQQLNGRSFSPWGTVTPESSACYYPFRVHRKPLTARLQRQDLQFSEHAMVLLTVGSHLDIKISGEWADRMRSLLDEHAQLSWLLVGGKGLTPPALQDLPQERLRVLPHSPGANNYMPACDIYINPPAMGGGFAVAEAMSVGLPALSLTDSDGGDKLVIHAATSLDDYFATLAAWIASPDARRQAGQQMQQRFDAELDLERAGSSLLAACRLAVEKFNSRPAFS
jgi:hypothetical protein